MNIIILSDKAERRQFNIHKCVLNLSFVNNTLEVDLWSANVVFGTDITHQSYCASP